MKIPSFHWWRTVFWLIPTISVYTTALGILSIGSSIFGCRGTFAHSCARVWAWLILVTAGVRVSSVGKNRVKQGMTYVFVSNGSQAKKLAISFDLGREFLEF